MDAKAKIVIPREGYVSTAEFCKIVSELQNTRCEFVATVTPDEYVIQFTK